MLLQVLIVEDDELMRNSLVDTFESKGHNVKVLTAANPVEALEQFHLYKDTLTHVVVDYFMPIDNGIEFCKVVKDNRPNVEVILFTGNHEIEKSGELSYVDKLFLKPNGRELVSYITS